MFSNLHGSQCNCKHSCTWDKLVNLSGCNCLHSVSYSRKEKIIKYNHENHNTKNKNINIKKSPIGVLKEYLSRPPVKHVFLLQTCFQIFNCRESTQRLIVAQHDVILIFYFCVCSIYFSFAPCVVVFFSKSVFILKR